jgi:ribosomal protein L21E
MFRVRHGTTGAVVARRGVATTVQVTGAARRKAAIRCGEGVPVTLSPGGRKGLEW